jgi:inorganic pyrophosphatase
MKLHIDALMGEMKDLFTAMIYLIEYGFIDTTTGERFMVELVELRLKLDALNEKEIDTNTLPTKVQSDIMCKILSNIEIITRNS